MVRWFPGSVFHLFPTLSTSLLSLMISKLASVFLIFTCAMALEVAPRKILLGENISTTNRWPSLSGHFAFGFYPEGRGFAIGAWLVGSSTVIWTANRDDEPIPKEDAELYLTKDGLKLLRRIGDRTISNIPGGRQASHASMLDTGNFVIYSSDSTVIWQSFDYPTDTIMANQTLLSGQELVSSSESNHSTGRFRLKMQIDNNLVMYPTDTSDIAEHAYWASNTYGWGYYQVSLDDSGRMYLMNDNYTHLVLQPQGNSSRRQSTIYFARLDPDGFLRLFSHYEIKTEISAQIPEWDRCRVKGICGSNSFCDSTGNQVECSCLPGFDYIDATRKFIGCQSNFSQDRCPINEDHNKYNMAEMENITWDSDWYSPPSEVKSKDECRVACLHDCNCRAALFTSGSCSKQKFPFKYLRKSSSSDEPITAFLKVGSAVNRPVETVTVRQKVSDMKVLIASVVAAACLPIVVAGAGFFICKNRVARYRKLWENVEIALSEGMAPRSFSYNELRRATQGFRVQLGKGGFGTVFKGTLSDGETNIAVKKLDESNEKMAKKGERSFRMEVKVIGKTHHRNLVRLLGFCQEGSKRLLVYEYMSNGSLADLIFDPERWPRWCERVRIALEVARGILYLHEGCETTIIHSDIKPQNILLDDKGTAKISDFGLAKLLMPAQTRTLTQKRGTSGYVAPEWNGQTPISAKVDVFSFGIVLLELLCCRKNIEAEVEPEEIILTEWAYNCLLARELDKLLRGEEAEMAELERLVKIGLWCLQQEPNSRPSMKEVVMMLEGNLEVPLPPPLIHQR